MRGSSRREIDEAEPGPEVDGDTSEPPQKRIKLSGAQRKKLAKEEAKKRRGANKARKFARTGDDVQLCWSFASSGTCEAGSEYVHCFLSRYRGVTAI